MFGIQNALLVSTFTYVLSRYYVSSATEVYIVIPLNMLDDQNSSSGELENPDLSKILRTRTKVLKVETEESERKRKQREEKKAKLVHEQHQRKMKELNEFMKTHMISTNYFYDEMKRILRQRNVKNNLRRMVEYLEIPGHEKLRKQVLECFIEHRKEHSKAYNVFDKHEPNNLVINIVKDPFNEGVI